MKTMYPKAGEFPQGWHLVDASTTTLTLGRMASRVARVLMGKHRPIYTPHMDTGEFVVVVNASQVKVSGRKRENRMIRYHTQYLSGLKEIPLGKVIDSNPDRAIRLAVRRMLPKSKLGKAMLDKLKVYAGPEHPHKAQRPKPLNLETI